MWVLMEDNSYRNLVTVEAVSVIETSPGVWQLTIASSTATEFVIAGVSEATQADAQTALAAFLTPAGVATA